MSIFDSIISRRPKMSQFNLGHTRKFSFAPGQLYPCMLAEAMPSDRLSHDLTAMVRMMPMQAPVMHLVDVFAYTFKIPNRLLMEHSKWETFITGGAKGDGKDAQGNFIEIPYAMFHVGSNTVSALGDLNLSNGTLADYLGLSFGDMTGPDEIRINMMPFIAFWLVWNEYFRDQNVHPDYVGRYPGIFQASGDITAAIFAAITDSGAEGGPMLFFNVPKVCWAKDYLTSALPFAQRGEPVQTPLQGTAEVTYKAAAQILKPATAQAGNLGGGTIEDAPLKFVESPSGTSHDAGLDNIEQIDLVSGGFSINDLRTAARLQEWLEKMARGGSRYTEQLRSMFGVKSSDARLQRPEYLAGGKVPVNISEVLQTSENGETPLAAMAGHGISAGKINGWSSFFEEHSYVLSVIFMRPKTAYQQGIPRMFTRRFDKLDWPWPSFAQLGEQEVLMDEVYAEFDNGQNADLFGYQQRYAEMKYIPSTVHGEFKTTLDFWHWGRIFSSRPTLSKEFVECDPSPRIFNVVDSNSHPCYCVLNNNLTGLRPLPYYGEPTL